MNDGFRFRRGLTIKTMMCVYFEGSKNFQCVLMTKKEVLYI